MKRNFDRAFLLVIGAEGKPTNDPDDPGGYTIWGLAKRYNPEIGPDTTIDEAKRIYYQKYWGIIDGDNLPDKLDIAAFDCAVNPGTGVALRILKETRDWQDFLIKRLRYYSDLVQKHPEKIKYFRGWVNRVLNLWAELKR